MKTLHLFLLLLAITTLACCKKDKYETTITGHVYTHGTTDFPGEQPLKILLIEETGGSGLSAGERVKANTYTDNNGYYKFEFESDNSRHWVRIDDDYTPPMHFTPNNSNGALVNIGSNQTLNLSLTPFAWLELHVENVNPQVGDVLSLTWNGSYSRDFIGPANEHVVLKTAGNINRSFVLTLFRNSISSVWRDTVWLPAFDTTYHKIEY